MPSEAPPDHFPKPEPSLETVSGEERSKEYQEFLKYVAQSTGHISYEQLCVIYPAICQAAMEWLIREKKSVDFGFLVMHPVPHRANWKQAMLALFPRLGPTLLGKTREIKHALLEGCGFYTKLLSGELLAVCRERFVVWGVDIQLRKPWWKAMLRQEAHLHAKLGSLDYASYIARQIVRLRPKLVDTYLSFLRQTAYPAARIQHGRAHRRGYIVPFIPKGRVRPVGDANLPVDLVVPRDPAALITPKLADVAIPDAELPEVPNIRQDAQDLRVGVGKSIAGVTNAGGLSVLDAPKGEVH